MLGTNMFTAGRLVIYMGTAAWVARGFETDDPQAPTIGATSSCGSALKWYLNKLCQEETSAFEELEAQACDLPVGSDGMVFLPHLMGERSPYRKPAAKGVFFGLTLSHDRAHMYRAILEGTSCHLRHILEDCGGADAREIWCVGGCAAIELWMQARDHAPVDGSRADGRRHACGGGRRQVPRRRERGQRLGAARADVHAATAQRVRERLRTLSPAGQGDAAVFLMVAGMRPLPSAVPSTQRATPLFARVYLARERVSCDLWRLSLN
jgi:hypothetical protein